MGAAWLGLMGRFLIHVCTLVVDFCSVMIFAQGRHHDELMRAQHRVAFEKICALRGLSLGASSDRDAAVAFPVSADGAAFVVDCHALHADEAVDFVTRAIEGLQRLFYMPALLWE
jgi:hypothetical protein